jgi:Flp pilus assembly protein TadD
MGRTPQPKPLIAMNEAVRQHCQAAIRLMREDRLEEAERHYRAALQMRPGQPEALTGLGRLCLRTGRMDEAIHCFESALATAPGHKSVLLGLGEALAVAGRQNEAKNAYERLLAGEPENAEAHFGLGSVLKQLGRFAESQRAFAQAVELAPREPAYHRALAEAAPFLADDPRLAALEALLREEHRFSERQKVELHFGLFKAYDDLKRYAPAFEHLERGNRLYRKLVPYEESQVFALFREIEETYTPAAIAAHAGMGHQSELPVFVVGMPRSGTTLVEQILASHPEMFGAGELTFFQDLINAGFAGEDYPAGLSLLGDGGLRRLGGAYAARIAALAPKAKRITDKLPANGNHLGLIHLALPKARIVHVRRDPRDTCFSCYSKLFASGLNFAYELGELGRFHKAYDRLMAHWHQVLAPRALLEVRYETLVADFAAEARRLVEFCGLEWDERCLNFHETRRAVRTLSEYQVRQKLFTSSIGRWQPYAQWLGPLFEALG